MKRKTGERNNLKYIYALKVYKNCNDKVAKECDQIKHLDGL